MPARRRHPIVFWSAACLVILLVAAAGASYVLLRADPSWYERVSIDPAQQAAGERAMRDRLATLHNEIGRSHVAVTRAATAGDGAQTGPTEFPSFDVRFTEDEVNGVIARWEDNPGVRSALGELTEPHVRFLKDRLEIAGRSPTMNSLVSIELSVAPPAKADGAPTVTLGRPWAGRLPLSRGLINADAIVEKLRGGNDGKLPEPFLAALATLLKGDPVTPPIVLVSSSYNGAELLPARIERLALDRGTLAVTLRPFLVDATK